MLAKQARGVHPLVTNYWLAEGAALSGLLLLAVSPRVRPLQSTARAPPACQRGL